MSRFYNLEKTLQKNESLKKNYHKEIRDLIDTNRVSLVTNGSKGRYYLPHHAVVKEDSRSTKVRPVFDGSCITSNGKSLNQVLLTGKKLQSDLQLMLMYFRKYEYAVTADIQKMFLMIKVNSSDRAYLRFLYRNENERSKDSKIKEYEFFLQYDHCMR